MRRINDEDGQVLLLALAFLIFFGMVIAAILTFADASVRASERLREQRATVYAADGATDAAIQYARLNEAAGVGFFGLPESGTPNCMQTPEFSLTNTTGDQLKAIVTCVSVADPTDQHQRTVRFTTRVNGVVTVIATVLFQDNLAGAPVFVQSWTYAGHSAS